MKRLLIITVSLFMMNQHAAAEQVVNVEKKDVDLSKVLAHDIAREIILCENGQFALGEKLYKLKKVEKSPGMRFAGMQLMGSTYDEIFVEVDEQGNEIIPAEQVAPDRGSFVQGVKKYLMNNVKALAIYLSLVPEIFVVNYIVDATDNSSLVYKLISGGMGSTLGIFCTLVSLQSILHSYEEGKYKECAGGVCAAIMSLTLQDVLSQYMIDYITKR